MKILWITNGLFPEATAKLNGAKELKSTGGWMMSLAEALLSYTDVKICVAALSPLVKELTSVQGSNMTYYAIPFGKGDSRYNKEHEAAFKEIYKKEQPDIVHINGTEFPHSLAAFNVCDPNRTLVSIQGMVSVYAPYYLAGISKTEVMKNLTLHDLIRTNLIQEQSEMERRGKYEIELIRRAKYVTGRTSWDKENTWAINPKAVFMPCYRIFRPSFYENNVWNYSNCVRHSIFLSQAAKPLKGLHKVIEAMTIVVKFYPDVLLRVAGRDITRHKGLFSDRFHITTYGNMIRKLIKKNHLENNIVFTGPLNGDMMKQEYLNCNLFICPSSIENSPNSLGEAQILGVPCLASYVGGSMDMMKGDEDHLYRFEETGMLAAKICQIFEKGNAVDTEGMRMKAFHRHNPKEIVATQLKIYKDIIGNVYNVW